MKSNSPKKRSGKKATPPTKAGAEKHGSTPRAEAKPAKKSAKKSPVKKTKPAESSSKTATPTRSSKAKERKTPELPRVLFEDDRHMPAEESGPGTRFALGNSGGSAGSGELHADLPEAYGTGKLILAARDPHWLYASWDLTRTQLRDLNRQSPEGHLRLRVFDADRADNPTAEIAVHPESRHWFVHVADSDRRYIGCLGYRDESDQWQTIATSTPTLVPADFTSQETTADFATIPVDVPFGKLMEVFRTATKEHTSLSRAIHELRENGQQDLPDPMTTPDLKWTPEQQEAMAALISVDELRRVWMGSLEITELIRRQIARGVSSGEVSSYASGPGSPTSARLWESVSSGSFSSAGEASWSSPSGSWETAPGNEGFPGRSFWFNVNAELIIYGATEPDAAVTIGGRPIRLRGDGTFSYRFALPDGRYALPVVATSSDKVEQRSAGLEFGRHSEYRGHVDAHPQDPNLKPPLKEHVA